MFTNWDVFWGLGKVSLGATSQWPLTNSTGFGGIEPLLDDQPVEWDASFVETTTQTASPAMSSVELTTAIPPLDRTEEENPFVLVVTALIRQLQFGDSQC